MLSSLLVLGGFGLMIIGGIMIAIAAFKESVLWGIGCLVIPIVSLIFVLTHFEESKTGLFAYIAGIGAIILGGMLGHG